MIENRKERKMRNGIDRDNFAREIDRNLQNEKLVTMSRAEARAFVDCAGVPADFDDLTNALDHAQGEENEAGRYVVIYVEPGSY
jgi:folate-dependent tRNA-U54 methylase TrmFO/GidA